MKKTILTKRIYSPTATFLEEILKYQDLVAKRDYWVEQYGLDGYKNLIYIYENNLHIPEKERVVFT